jgi:hypothetical protein
MEQSRLKNSAPALKELDAPVSKITSMYTADRLRLLCRREQYQ